MKKLIAMLFAVAMVSPIAAFAEEAKGMCVIETVTTNGNDFVWYSYNVTAEKCYADAVIVKQMCKTAKTVNATWTVNQ